MDSTDVAYKVNGMAPWPRFSKRLSGLHVTDTGAARAAVETDIPANPGSASKTTKLLSKIKPYITGMHPTSVHLMGVHVMGVHLTGVHVMGIHFMGMHLIGVYLTGMSHRRTLQAFISQAFISWACTS